MNGPPAGALRAALAAAGLAVGAAGLARLPLPGPARAAGMLALPWLLVCAFRRQDAALSRAAEAVRSRSRPPPAPPRR